MTPDRTFSLSASMTLDKIRSEIIAAVGSYASDFWRRPDFIPGETPVNYSAQIFDQGEIVNLVDCALSGKITAGRWTEEFERKMRAFFCSRDFILVNSGSSANLLMLAALCSPNVEGHLRDGDEVVTVALGFPTTLAPIVQHRLVPVFVDVSRETYNPDPGAVEAAIGPRTRAVFLPHPMGFPFDAEAVRGICERRGLWFIEDGADALGATFGGRLVGTFGAMSSLSHFPAHHLSGGESGSVIVNSSKVGKTARSIMNWGKDCWCQPGQNNTCGQRFGWQLGALPFGHDHKFCFSNIGYNLKATDLQAAVLCAQADKIGFIVGRRRQNYRRLHEKLLALSDFFSLPEIHPAAIPSPYAFPLLVKPGRGITRDEVVRRLEAAKIETRPIFGGNLLRQPAFQNIKHRVAASLDNTDRIMRDGFFVGVHPYLGEAEMDYVFKKLKEAVSG